MEESEIDATSRLRIHEIMVKDSSNMSYDELVSWAEEEAEMKTPKKKVVEHVVDDVDILLMNLAESPKIKLKKAVEKGKSTMVEDAITLKKAVDKGKNKMVKEDCPVCFPVRRYNGIVIQDNVNPSVESDTDSESDPAQGINYSLYSDSDNDSYSDKSVDYLSEGEDELIELRKRNTEAKKSDNETAIEHKGSMDDLLRKPSQDNGNGMTDMFHIVETKVEKYPIHDVDTYWRMRKPKVQAIENEAKTEIFGLNSIKFAHFSKSRRNLRKGMSTPLDRAQKNESNCFDLAQKLDPVQILWAKQYC
ncbi:hypothetical protein Tco_0696734 [Tanacetum coccineum]